MKGNGSSVRNTCTCPIGNWRSCQCQAILRSSCLTLTIPLLIFKTQLKRSGSTGTAAGTTDPRARRNGHYIAESFSHSEWSRHWRCWMSRRPEPRKRCRPWSRFLANDPYSTSEIFSDKEKGCHTLSATGIKTSTRLQALPTKFYCYSILRRHELAHYKTHSLHNASPMESWSTLSVRPSLRSMYLMSLSARTSRPIIALKRRQIFSLGISINVVSLLVISMVISLPIGWLY